jgi:hypothetical protein
MDIPQEYSALVSKNPSNLQIPDIEMTHEVGSCPSLKDWTLS